MPQVLLDQNKIITAYNKAAANYDKSAVLQQEVTKRMLERLAIFTIQPSVIIDVGCGTGQSYRALKKRYRKAKVIGVDKKLLCFLMIIMFVLMHNDYHSPITALI